MLWEGYKAVFSKVGWAAFFFPRLGGKNQLTANLISFMVVIKFIFTANMG